MFELKSFCNVFKNVEKNIAIKEDKHFQSKMSFFLKTKKKNDPVLEKYTNQVIVKVQITAVYSC